MGLWNDLSNELNIKKNNNKETHVDNRNSDDGPSTLVKQSLSAAAAAFFKTSKKIVSSIVSKYQPQISTNLITESKDIDNLLSKEIISKKEYYSLLSNDFNKISSINEKDVFFDKPQNEELKYIIEILKKISLNNEDPIDIKIILSKLDKKYPDWYHPLLMEYILQYFYKNYNLEKKKQSLEKLLTNNPLHSKGLELAKDIYEEGDLRIINQISDLIIQ